MQTEQQENRVVETKQNVKARKPYRRPRLAVHGTLQQITGNVGNGFVDFPMGSRIAG